MNELKDTNENPNAQDKGTNRGNLIPGFEAVAFVVTVSSSGLADHTQIVHWEESEVESEKHQSKDELPKFFAHHAPGYFRKPVIKAGKQSKQSPSDENIVKMRNHEVSVLVLSVDRN